MIRPTGSVNSEQVRLLLQRFRDLNLGPCGIDVAQGSRVVIEGCLSLDHPVELGVRYGVRDEAGRGRVLNIAWDQTQLDISLSDDDTPQARLVEHLDVDLETDDHGRLAAPELGARLNLESSDARDVEHFLRRIVRAVYSQAG